MMVYLAASAFFLAVVAVVSVIWFETLEPAAVKRRRAMIYALASGGAALLVSSICLVQVAQAIAEDHTTFQDAVGFKGGIYLGTATADGTQIQDSYAASSTQDLASIAANVCLDSSAITVTGAAVNDICAVGGATTPGATNLVLSCYVDAANSVKVRACNPTVGAIDPASQVYAVRTFDP